MWLIILGEKHMLLLSSWLTDVNATCSGVTGQRSRSVLATDGSGGPWPARHPRGGKEEEKDKNQTMWKHQREQGAFFEARL